MEFTPCRNYIRLENLPDDGVLFLYYMLSFILPYHNYSKTETSLSQLPVFPFLLSLL